MKLITEDQSQKLPIEIKKYNTFLKRFKGLMFRIKPITNEGILLDPCNSIHMFFMFFPIDAIFLNEQNQILYLKEKVKPWRIILPVKGAKTTLELPVGTISRYSIKIGDILDF